MIEIEIKVMSSYNQYELNNFNFLSSIIWRHFNWKNLTNLTKCDIIGFIFKILLLKLALSIEPIWLWYRKNERRYTICVYLIKTPKNSVFRDLCFLFRVRTARGRWSAQHNPLRAAKFQKNFQNKKERNCILMAKGFTSGFI